MPWSARFEEPIELPDGTSLRALRDAIKYLGKTVPKAEHDHPAVLTPATILTQAAEGGPAWMMFARSATLKAIYRNRPPRAFNSDRKKTHWGKLKRKLKLKQDE